jgi:FixJ family two-component response regulator
MNAAATIAISTGNTTAPIHVFSRDLALRGLAPQTTSQTQPTVFVVDGDVYMRQGLDMLIRSQGWQPQGYSSAREFLGQARPCVPSCLILAFSTLDSNGLAIQKLIARECSETPIIIVADYEDIPTTVQAMKAGAVDFLLKPISEELLVAAIQQSLERSRATHSRGMEMRNLRDCYASLSRRERQVMALVVSGRLNKQVGGELGISEITVKAHRGQVMQKMKAPSFPHLVNMASKLRITSSMIPSVI